jgi:hypothetical protein
MKKVHILTPDLDLIFLKRPSKMEHIIFFVWSLVIDHWSNILAENNCLKKRIFL